ncbi:MAG: hypothetical protein ACT4N4_09530 [Rhodospirillales bacterium]
MAIEFEVMLRTVENGIRAYDRHAQFRLGDFGPAIELSQRMIEDAARNFHGIANPTPADLTNVMCNELFHLMREDERTDQRRTGFIAGMILRLCALPEDAPNFSGLGRHPVAGERLYLSIFRKAVGEDRYAHGCAVSTKPPIDA